MSYVPKLSSQQTWAERNNALICEAIAAKRRVLQEVSAYLKYNSYTLYNIGFFDGTMRLLSLKALDEQHNSIYTHRVISDIWSSGTNEALFIICQQSEKHP